MRAALIAAFALSLTQAALANPPAKPAKEKKHISATTRFPDIDCRPCGAPAECQLEKKDAEELRAAKKKVMLYDYPARIVDKLVDPQPPCAECVWGPDEGTVNAGVSLMTVQKNGNYVSMGWSKEDELSARHGLKKGTLKAFYFIHLAEACTCCLKGADGKWTRQTPPQKRHDWDKHLGISKDAAVKFEKPADLGPEPADLADAANRAALK
jgi:hypothetical protein